MKLRLTLFSLLAIFSFNLKAEEIKFIDKNGQNIICKISSSGDTDCKNEKNETVICGNDDNSNYTCSSH